MKTQIKLRAINPGIPVLLVALSLSFAIFQGCSKPEPQANPNIVLIMSDDMGYSDLGCYGGEINTPNLDGLAKNGLQFTQFYNTARCCPTRASLMTGLNPHQTGIGHMTNTPTNFTQHDLGIPQYRGFLNRNCVTIAEVLKGTGYSTLMAGKWHLGMSTQDKWPLQRGFDKYYGIIPGASNYFKPVHPRGITVGNDTITITDPDYYTTDAFTDNAIRFIGESRQESDNPFFLYLAFNAPHWPLHAPQEDIDRYKGKYMDGWQALRQERYQRMIELGLIDSDWELTEQDSRDWNSLDDEKKKEMDLRMAIYAAQVDRMDQNIGKLVTYLEEQDILDNTIIIFLDDNGACAEGGELGRGAIELLESKDGYSQSYGRAWANASNTPYREYKHWVHEGGIATPFIVHWPDGIAENDLGQLVNEYGFLPDIMATCVDLTGAEYPQEYMGNKIPPMVGQSLLPLIKGKREQVHTDPIFWEHEGNKAVRLGKYKLVQLWQRDQEDNWELYDLEADRTETNDLAEEMPEKLEEMKAQYNAWAEEIQVQPWSEVIRIQREKREAQQNN
jgi:arylsulfatase A-like enzyme